MSGSSKPLTLPGKVFVFVFALAISCDPATFGERYEDNGFEPKAFDQFLKSLLEEYLEYFSGRDGDARGGTVAVPVGSFRAISQACSLGGGQGGCLVLAADKVRIELPGYQRSPRPLVTSEDDLDLFLCCC